MGFLKNLKRAGLGLVTGGLSEFAQKDSFGVPNSGQYLPVVAGTALGSMMGNPMMGAQMGLGMFSASQEARNQEQANAQNVGLAREQMQFSAGQAQKQMDFQERMSSTSMQRATADMKAAGLNPLLALPGGASSPGGAAGSSAGANIDPLPSTGSRFTASAMDAVRLDADLGMMKDQRRGVRAESSLKELEYGFAKNNPNEYFTAKQGGMNTVFSRLLGSMEGSAKSVRRSINSDRVDHLIDSIFGDDDRYISDSEMRRRGNKRKLRVSDDNYRSSPRFNRRHSN